MPILGCSNSAANKDMMSKIWTDGIQLTDQVDNFVGKGEIAHYEKFHLFPQCFKSCPLLMRQNVYLWSKGLTQTSTMNYLNYLLWGA